MSKTVLITGASGLIGNKLVNTLSQKGYNLHILTTQPEKVDTKNFPKTFFWNPLKNQIDKSCLQKVNIIINLAGAPVDQRWTKTNKTKILESRTKSLTLLYNTISEQNVQIEHLITASAIGIYGNSETQYFDENHVSINDDSFLSTVVKQWEAATVPFETKGIKVSILRIGIVLDDKAGALPKLLKPIKYYVGAPLGSGHQWQSWIHIDDLVAMFYHILNNQLEGVYNAVSPNPVQQSELTKAIALALKRPLILPNVPETLLKLLLGAMSALVLQSQRVCANKIQATGFTFQYHELSAALEDLLLTS